jgi:hypothetical protein
VVEEVAVKGPPRLVGINKKAQPLAGLDEKRVLIGAVRTVPVFKLAPEPDPTKREGWCALCAFGLSCATTGSVETGRASLTTRMQPRKAQTC